MIAYSQPENNHWKSFKGKLIDEEISTDWDKKIHSIYNPIKKEDSFYVSD